MMQEKDISMLEVSIKFYHANKDNDIVVYQVFRELATGLVYLPVNEDGALISLVGSDRNVIPIFSRPERLGEENGVQLRGCYLKDYIDRLMEAGLDMIVNPFSEESIQFFLPYESLGMMLIPAMMQENMWVSEEGD